VRTVTAEADRAALVLAATGQAFAFTAGPDLHGPGVVALDVVGDPVPLRLRSYGARPGRRRPGRGNGSRTCCAGRRDEQHPGDPGPVRRGRGARTADARAVEGVLDGDADVDVDADDAVAMASVYKLPLLVAFCRLVDAGELDPRWQVTVGPEHRTSGSTGLSIRLDPVTMSLRDLAASMMSVSDNAAADALLGVVGFDAVAAAMTELGLTSTHVTRSVADTFAQLGRETGTGDLAAAMAALADNDRPISPTAYDPVLASATTARDMTTLLTALWTDTAASPAQCRFARTLLGHRVAKQRLAAGFPHDEVRTYGRTGTLGALRHEVGVVEFPGEIPVAVAVLTHAARADSVLPRAEAVIGQVANTAVSAIRWGTTAP